MSVIGESDVYPVRFSSKYDQVFAILVVVAAIEVFYILPVIVFIEVVFGIDLVFILTYYSKYDWVLYFFSLVYLVFRIHHYYFLRNNEYINGIKDYEGLLIKRNQSRTGHVSVSHSVLFWLFICSPFVALLLLLLCF